MLGSWSLVDNCQPLISQAALRQEKEKVFVNVYVISDHLM